MHCWKRPKTPWASCIPQPQSASANLQAELEAAGIHTTSSSTTSSSSSSAAPPALYPGGPSAASKGLLSRTGLLLSRPRRAFGAAVSLSDAPAAELWASSTSEVWPFKDAAYDLKRVTLEAAAQAVPVLQEAAVQVGW